ncbi:MAG: hypothetical protein ACI956_000776, partial [Nonlabens sp.]
TLNKEQTLLLLLLLLISQLYHSQMNNHAEAAE